MRNQQCPKPECMYLHHYGDTEASFTKEDMQLGKHQDYERKLLEDFAQANSGAVYVDWLNFCMWELILVLRKSRSNIMQ